MILIPQSLFSLSEVTIILQDGHNCIIKKEPSETIRQKEGYISNHAISILLSGSQMLTNYEGKTIHIQQGEMIMKLLKKLNEDGMTIVQVTHNEKYANYGSRIIQLEDGLVREDRLIEKSNSMQPSS